MGMTEYPDEKLPRVRAWLERGWEWLKENDDRPKADEYFDQWLEVLHKYEDTYGTENVDDRDELAQNWMSG